LRRLGLVVNVNFSRFESLGGFVGGFSFGFVSGFFGSSVGGFLRPRSHSDTVRSFLHETVGRDRVQFSSSSVPVYALGCCASPFAGG